MRKMTIKEKIGREWKEIAPPKKSAIEILKDYDGRDIVIEINTGEGKVYFCGNEAAEKLMHKKGITLSCADAAKIYAQRQVKDLDTIVKVFTEEQEERIAIKMESGIPENEAIQQTIKGI